MKKIAFIALSLIVFAGYSCKDTKKEKEQTDTNSTVKTEQYSIVKDSTKVSFVAYKTIEKKPVGGTFTKINITKSTTGSTAMEALNGTTFSIPVSSLFTNDATGTRDPKLLEFFFGVMKDTELISGVFKTEANNTCSIDITLNGETANIPLTFEATSDNSYTFNGVMDLKEWNALDAVASLNKACEVLHTGADGVSKTWSEVAVKAEVLLEKK
ncbi:YceI family protein [uncultured Maribacter sp.]|uniref:YceI family protein n=1 Tax=uncultured Maribacter sp. TaxID=431308 RepID=UPI0026066AD5|nr:YceI family protein [uncultured Maribacter sp.]